MSSRVICIDWDGTLTEGDGYNAPFSEGMRPGAADFLRELERRGFRPYILTARSPSAQRQIRDLLSREGFPSIEVGNVKVPAFAYVDDRAIPFSGSFDDALHRLVKWDVEETVRRIERESENP